MKKFTTTTEYTDQLKQLKLSESSRARMEKELGEYADFHAATPPVRVEGDSRSREQVSQTTVWYIDIMKVMQKKPMPIVALFLLVLGGGFSLNYYFQPAHLQTTTDTENVDTGTTMELVAADESSDSAADYGGQGTVRDVRKAAAPAPLMSEDVSVVAAAEENDSVETESSTLLTNEYLSDEGRLTLSISQEDIRYSDFGFYDRHTMSAHVSIPEEQQLCDRWCGSVNILQIRGFEYDPAYNYVLEIEQKRSWGYEAEDADWYDYTLVDIVSKTERGPYTKSGAECFQDFASHYNDTNFARVIADIVVRDMEGEELITVDARGLVSRSDTVGNETRSRLDTIELKAFVQALCENGSMLQQPFEDWEDGSVTYFSVYIPGLHNTHVNISSSFTGGIQAAEGIIWQHLKED